MNDMNTYLLRHYPVHPNAEINIVQLDCLNPSFHPPVSQNHCDYVECLLNELEKAIFRGHVNGRIYYWNNSSLYIGQAKNVFDFISMYKEEQSKIYKAHKNSKHLIVLDDEPERIYNIFNYLRRNTIANLDIKNLEVKNANKI